MKVNMFEDPEISGMNDSMFRAWIYILCMAGKEDKKVFFISENLASGRVNLDSLCKTVSYMRKCMVITTFDFDDIEKVDDVNIENHSVIPISAHIGNPICSLEKEKEKEKEKRREENKGSQNFVLPVPLFVQSEESKPIKNIEKKARPQNQDLEEIYQSYPLKKGKSGGMKLAQKLKPEQLPLLKKSIQAYRLKITDPKFIKHFSTFMGEWEDWLDPNAGSCDLRMDGKKRYNF